MRNISDGRGRAGFMPIGQNDIDDHNSDSDERGRRQPAGRERFRRTVYQPSRQAPSVLPQSPDFLSAHSSPALSDSTVFSNDYMSLPIQHFDEVDLNSDGVDLTDARGTYAEPASCYGPEVVDNHNIVSDSYFLKDGKDIQVRVESHPLALSPGGLYVDDHLQDFSYVGPEGIIDGSPLLATRAPFNYKPVPLRWCFLLTVLGGLVVVLALSELALRLLPDASDAEGSLPAFQNISEIRKRSDLRSEVMGPKWHFARHGNGTAVISTTEVSSSTTELHSTTEAHSTTEVSSTTEVRSTTEVGGQPTSSIHFSTTERATTTKKPHDEQPSTTRSSAIKATSTREGLTETITPGTEQSHHSTQDLTSTLEGSSQTTTSPFTPTTGTEQWHHTTTKQNTASRTPELSVPASHITSDIPPFSTQTKNEVTSTEDHHISPEPSPTKGTSTLQVTTDRPQETTGHPQETTDRPPDITTTAQSQHSATTQQPSHPLSSGSPLPGPQGSSSTIDVDVPGPNTSTSASDPRPSPTGQTEETSDRPPAQDSSKPAGANSPGSSHQSKDQSTATSRQTESHHDNIGSTSTTTSHVTSTATIDQGSPSADPTTVTSGIKVFGSKDTVSQTDRTSTSTKLTERPEENETVEDKPFTTITMLPDTETPPPPITTSFTTSTTVSGGSYVEVTMLTTIVGHIKAADPLTEYVTATTYGNGTVSTISQKVYDRVSAQTEFDSAGNPTKTAYLHILNSAQTTTLKDPFGYPIATVEYYDVEVTTTLYDGNVPTATRTTIVAETPSPSTFYDSSGVPTKTVILLRPISAVNRMATASPTPPPRSDNQQTLELQRMSNGIYFVGLMLPTVLAILVFVPIRIVHHNVKLYQGFHALASDHGASASDSICMKTTGPTSLVDGIWSLKSGNYLLGLTSVLVILSALAIPFSAETFRLVLQGPQCHPDDLGKSKCSVGIGVFPTTARVLTVLVIILIVGITVASLLLRRWETGVERNPWSISYMAQLAANGDMRKVFEGLRRPHNANKAPGMKEFLSKLRGKTLGLGRWYENHVTKYSVLFLTQEVDGGTTEKTGNKPGRAVKFSTNPEIISRPHRLRWTSGDFVPSFMLSWIGRILFLVLLSGVLVTIITYNIVVRGSEYERGLTGKAVGVRFLFSGAGVLISFAWGSFFHAVAILSPYKLLHRKRLIQVEAFNVNPATNSFTGLWLAFVPSRRDTYLGVVSAITILSEALPLYLGNIPSNGIRLESMETICVYLSVAILSVMIITVGVSSFVSWPPTAGVDPSTIVGAMYAAHVFTLKDPINRFFRKETPDNV